MFICLPLFFPISSSKCAKSRFKLLLRSPDLRSVPTRSAPSQSAGQGEAPARRALVRGPARAQAAAAQARCWCTPRARPPGKAGPECCCRGAATSPPKHRHGQRGHPQTPSPIAGCGGEGAAAARGRQPSTVKEINHQPAGWKGRDEERPGPRCAQPGCLGRGWDGGGGGRRRGGSSQKRRMH